MTCSFKVFHTQQAAVSSESTLINLLLDVRQAPNGRLTAVCDLLVSTVEHVAARKQIFLSGVGGDQKTCQVG